MFLSSYRILVNVWENSKKLWKHSLAAPVPTAFLVLPNFHSCFFLFLKYLFKLFARQLRGLSYSYWIVRNELCSFWWTTKPFVPGKCSYLWSYCWTISLPVQSPRSLRCYQVLLRQEASRPRWKQGCTLCPCARVILWSYCQRTNPRWECACPPRLTPSTGRLRILLNRIPSPVNDNVRTCSKKLRIR